ncbi:ZIP family metal transporter [Streptosporangium sp. 'caverna']|uniref:ZIP family metal transporter n=1 Tax=Streptosporangium sp. 'caverna' TaxID=2202249 RepID=UPI000D7D561B|nr:ZIP family metal transporter [Streptosporangium sp. 'caverna']AWS43199.1 ZIP family metal transporter [Streptosporangium sp. 'caverna']
MEDRRARHPSGTRLNTWLLGLLPLCVIAVAAVGFAVLDGPGLTARNGPPAEELTVERTILGAGSIELIVRNQGADPVALVQVAVNDAFTDFRMSEPEIGRLGSANVRVTYPWVDGEAYEVTLLTSTGGVVTHAIPVAVATPDPSGLIGLMALLGTYVGVIPVAIGMLWLPWLRRVPPSWVRALMALTIGLLAWLAIDAALEGMEVANAGASALGGAGLVAMGAVAAYLLLSGVHTWMATRPGQAGGYRLALLVSVGIGLHNLGEGLAIGSAYAVGALALGATLVVGFTIHNTTEGLAIVAPVSEESTSPPRLALLGLIAGGPAILGAWLGAATVQPAIAALLLGLGVGAIVQVILQIAPSVRDDTGRLLHPLGIAGILAGMALMYATGLLT